MNIQTLLRSFTEYVHDFTTKNYSEDYLKFNRTYQRFWGHNRSYQSLEPLVSSVSDLISVHFDPSALSLES